MKRFFGIRAGISKRAGSSLRSRQGGFTILELAVAIGIIFVFSSMGIVNYASVQEKSQQKVVVETADMASSALLAYMSDGAAIADAKKAVEGDFTDKVGVFVVGYPYYSYTSSLPAGITFPYAMRPLSKNQATVIAYGYDKVEMQRIDLPVL